MVSIIVPVYKSEKTLKRCIRSLTGQTYRDIEIIMVVEELPDPSGILADTLAKEDARIRVIHCKNEGVSQSRNRGIREAKGKYLRFVDADDYVEPDSVEILMSGMGEDTDLVVAGFHHLYFGRDIKKLPKKGTYRLKSLSSSDEEEIRRLYLDGFFNMPWNKLYRKDLVSEYFPTDMNLGEDLIFNQNYILSSERMVVVDRAVCNYIQDDRGTTLSTKKRMDKLPVALRLYEESCAFFTGLGIDAKGKPAEKALISFLDDIGLLAYDNSLKKEEVLGAIASYADAVDELDFEGETPKLKALDHRLLCRALQKKQFKKVRRLIRLRRFAATVLGLR